MSTVLPDEVLDVDLPTIRFVWRLARERGAQRKFALKFPDIFWPLLLVKEVFGRTPTAIKKIDVSPVIQCIWAILVDRTPGKGNTFLDKSPERCDTLSTENP